MAINPYRVLGVDQSAPREVIEAAYRALAKRDHPDVSSDPDAARRMKLINDAYEILSDPIQRSAWDREYLLAVYRESLSSTSVRATDGQSVPRSTSGYSVPQPERPVAYEAPKTSRRKISGWVSFAFFAAVALARWANSDSGSSGSVPTHVSSLPFLSHYEISGTGPKGLSEQPLFRLSPGEWDADVTIQSNKSADIEIRLSPYRDQTEPGMIIVNEVLPRGTTSFTGDFTHTGDWQIEVLCEEGVRWSLVMRRVGELAQ